MGRVGKPTNPGSLSQFCLANAKPKGMLGSALGSALGSFKFWPLAELYVLNATAALRRWNLEDKKDESPPPKFKHRSVKMDQLEKESVRAASEETSRELKTIIDSQDLDSVKQSQHLLLGRLQDSNAVLSHFNDYSANCFVEVSADLSRNTRVLRSMKSDLDYIFLKLRSMKAKILSTYPDAFPDHSTVEALDRRPDLELPQ